MGGRWLISLAAALAIVVIAAGCGGSDETAVAPLTKAQFTARADAACGKAADRFQSLYEKFVRETDLHVAHRKTDAQWLGIAERVLAPTVEREVQEIQSLGAPRGDKDRVAAILEALEEGVERVEARPPTMAYPGEQFDRARRLATAYGLKVCGSNR